MTFKVTPQTAKRAIAYIDRGDTYGQAAHDCEVTITSIRPYTDSGTEALLRLFNYLYRRPEEKRDGDIAFLRALAEKA